MIDRTAEEAGGWGPEEACGRTGAQVQSIIIIVIPAQQEATVNLSSPSSNSALYM